MSRTFLPPPAAGKGFVLPQNLSNDFVGGPDSLLENIRDNMAASAANSEGRAPSPFARVWQFRRDLAGESGPQEQARAVAAFRGILSVFALRDFYHLLVHVDATPSLARDAQNAETALSRLFAVHTAYLPEQPAPARARFLFGGRLVYFRVVEPPGTPGTVLAGYSPLTLIYPAARRLNRSRTMNAIFWYDANLGRWHDPLYPPGHLPPRLSHEACARLVAWLDQVLEVDPDNDHQLFIFAQDGLASADNKFIGSLLGDWRRELLNRDTRPVGKAHRIELTKSPNFLEVERSQNRRFHTPILLEMVHDSTASPTDSPFRNGTLVITLAQAANPAHLIYGNVFGSPELASLLAGKPAEGADLGEAMGRPGEARVSYVILDKLFTPRLGRLREGDNAVSPLWTALTLLDDSKLKGIFLLPFEPALLRYFSTEEIKLAVKAENSIHAVQISFRHEAEGLEVMRNYDLDAGHVVTLDPSLDLRFFPDFRLDLLLDTDLQLPFPEDRFYYARARLSPELDKLQMRWLAADGSLLPEMPEIMGTFERPDQKSLAPGRHAFWRLSMQTTPGAFQVTGYGFLLLALRGSSQADAARPGQVAVGRDTRQRPRQWTVALDFGTTNSCVAVDTGAESVTSAYRLPIFTTTFLTSWQTELRGESDEGYSALADFMFWQNRDTDVLNKNEFFPTQVLTQYPLSIEALPYPGGFDERNGLAFFPNVSLVALEQKGFPDLLKGFDSMRVDSVIQPRFNLKRNLKWKEAGRDGRKSLVWRTAFHQHLRLQLILAAANDKAYIKDLVASYPKAFIPDQVKDYHNELAKIWGSAAADGADSQARGSHVTIELRSESAAAAVALDITRGQEFFLLDMGGGTTDVAVFKDNTLEEECSLTLAGQIFERYVCSSAKLRHHIANCFDEAMQKWRKAFEKVDQPDQMYQTLFQGFLVRRGGAAALSVLKNEGRSDPSTQGFFLSAIFLYTGLAYFCGLWLAKRRQGGKGLTSEERLQWLGNGSAFIQMLSVGDKSFEEVLVRMFNAACNGSATVSKMRSDGKTVVAKGLLKPPAVESAAGGQKVFSSLLSDSVTSHDHPWAADETLMEFYQKYSGSGWEWDGISENKVFRTYLEALQKELPLMKFNMSLLVNIDALGIPASPNWAVDYVKENRPRLQTKLFERLNENKHEWHDELRTGSADALYVEPLFVSELVALLEQVRERFA